MSNGNTQWQINIHVAQAEPLVLVAISSGELKNKKDTIYFITMLFNKINFIRRQNLLRTQVVQMYISLLYPHVEG